MQNVKDQIEKDKLLLKPLERHNDNRSKVVRDRVQWMEEELA